LNETVHDAVLSKSSSFINAPTPERCAVHKLIVSTMQDLAGERAGKADRDIALAAMLTGRISIKRRLDEFKEFLREANKCGAGRREYKKAQAARRKTRGLSKPLS